MLRRCGLGQFGIEPEDREIETTESQYQDGVLQPEASAPAADSGLPSLPSSSELAEARRQPLQQTQAQTNPNESQSRSDAPPSEIPDKTDPTVSEERSLPPLRETLLEGPPDPRRHRSAPLKDRLPTPSHPPRP